MTFRRKLAANANRLVKCQFFQKFERRHKKFEILKKKNYMDEKVLELPETCKSTKIFF
jgi:hypothetical protein